ncbi:MAG: hypothetical protein ACRELF_20785 [Gemmataceae bacterium]
MLSFLCCLWAEGPLGPPLIGDNIVIYSAIGGALLLLLLLILWLRRGRRPPIDPEAALIEKLGDYPPAGPGAQRLRLHGQSLRLRLVVLAPMGKRTLPANGALEPLLELALSGLGALARQDRPRLRVWPAQLSQQGFAPTFFRLTHRPEPAGKPSPWVLAAGPVRVGGHQFLLGLALIADAPAIVGNLALQANQWNEVFRIG